MKLFAAFVWVLLVTTTASAADLAGEWELSLRILNDVTYARGTWQVDGDKLTGNIGENRVDGTTTGDDVVFTLMRPAGQPAGRFTATLMGGELKGSAVLPDVGETTWTARRAAKRPDRSQTHAFEPTEFHRVFSDAIPPVLRIFPGDTVRTWTVDAGGVDSKGVRRSQGGNPQTGPFYIEGAMPGDTLVVKLTRVRLNRDSAISSGRIASSALTPQYVQSTKYQDNFDSSWALDRTNGIGRLKNPSARLQNYAIRLQPMLGCIAVAPPAHQSFRTGYPGTFGGNMDYNQMREGTTLYLPVFAPGALLFVGDGHAAQGDGELTGNALETSMDVEFAVDVIRGRSTGAPRAENDEYLMSSGIGNSLPEALQLATTQLAEWLQREYKLEPNEAAVVLGTVMRYDVAEVVDPLVHVVAKVRKDALAELK